MEIFDIDFILALTSVSRRDILYFHTHHLLVVSASQTWKEISNCCGTTVPYERQPPTKHRSMHETKSLTESLITSAYKNVSGPSRTFFAFKFMFLYTWYIWRCVRACVRTYVYGIIAVATFRARKHSAAHISSVRTKQLSSPRKENNEKKCNTRTKISCDAFAGSMHVSHL